MWLRPSLALLLLAGCGFTPLYASRDSGTMNQALSSIRVTPVADVSPDSYRDDYYRQGQASRLAQLFRDGLATRMSGGSDARYILQANIEQRLEGFGVRPDESFTRERITLIARYELKNAADGKLVFRGESKSDGGVDRVLSEYATLAAERSAAERNARQLVRDITAKLALVLRGNLKEGDGLTQPEAPPVPLPSDGLGTAGTRIDAPR